MAGHVCCGPDSPGSVSGLALTVASRGCTGRRHGTAGIKTEIAANPSSFVYRVNVFVSATNLMLNFPAKLFIK